MNPFSKLRDVWDRYATAISMFLSIQYAIIMVMLGAVLLKYGISEFYRDGTDDEEYQKYSTWSQYCMLKE